MCLLVSHGSLCLFLLILENGLFETRHGGRPVAFHNSCSERLGQGECLREYFVNPEQRNFYRTK